MIHKKTNSKTSFQNFESNTNNRNKLTEGVM